MTASTLLADLLRILAHSSAPTVAADCLQRLDRALGGTHVLWLADLQHTVLTGGGVGAEVVRIDDSWQGRCFASQSTLRHERQVLVPVTARGDRLGVLERQGDPGDGDVQDSLELVAAVLALALTSRTLGTDGFERLRRTQPLTVAAELQWALLHGRAYRDSAISVAGTLEPAYAIAGDAYDWSRNDDRLTLAVLDGTGRGVPAALTTVLALTALRNARASGLSLADQAALSDQAVFAHHGGEAFVSALLVEVDVQSGQVAVIDAGSPLLLHLRAGAITRVALDHQLPLGMFEESIYTPQSLQLEPGDRLVIVSDGMHASTTQDGPAFGERHLNQALLDSRLLSASELTRQVVRALRGTLSPQAEGRVDDDAVIVCVDWPGPQ